ncbi:MAG TPA: hypothetical protein VGI95_02595 [Caulobacteraceae bacterium]
MKFLLAASVAVLMSVGSMASAGGIGAHIGPLHAGIGLGGGHHRHQVCHRHHHHRVCHWE